MRKTLSMLLAMTALAVGLSAFAPSSDIYRPYPPCTRTTCW